MAILLPSAEVCKLQIAKAMQVESGRRERTGCPPVECCVRKRTPSDESPSLYRLEPRQ